jgi:hypothetical protein
MILSSVIKVRSHRESARKRTNKKIAIITTPISPPSLPRAHGVVYIARTPFVLGTSVPPVRSIACLIANARALNDASALRGGWGWGVRGGGGMGVM